MAATDARPVPRKNAAFRFYFAIRKNDGTLITTWAGADSEVSIDGAAFADCTNEATEIGTSGCGYIDLTSSEMNGDAIVLKVTVTNTSAIPVVVTFFPEESGDYRCDTVMISGDSTAADNCELMFDGTGYAGGTTKLDVNLVNIAGSAVNASSAQLGVNVVNAGGTAWGSGAITASVIATGAIDADSLAADAGNEIADAVLNRDLSVAAGGASSSRTVLQALRFLRNRWVVSGGTLTVYAEDDTTSDWTSTLTTNASADPITESNPA